MKAQKFTRSKAKKLLPKRLKHHNKTHGGKVLVIAGSAGMFGAAILTATASARVGAGYTQLLSDLKEYSFQKNPDFLTAEVSKAQISKLKFDAVAIGPGLGVHKITEKKIQELLKLKIENVVVDADALTVLAKKKIHPLPKSWILTPHSGELSRLIDVPYQDIQKNPEKYLLKAQKKFGCIVLLKGFPTLIASEKEVIEVRSGNSALAKSGTGDVLSGMIAGLLAQGLRPLDAAGLATYIHGRMAKDWVSSKKDHLSLLASDLLKQLPETLYSLRKS